MGAFAVDLDQLDDVVAHMTSFEATIQSQLDALDARIDRLQSLWTGAAAGAQRAAHTEWMTGATAMRDALTATRKAAATAHANYTAAVAANTAMWG